MKPPFRLRLEVTLRGRSYTLSWQLPERTHAAAATSGLVFSAPDIGAKYIGYSLVVHGVVVVAFVAAMALPPDLVARFFPWVSAPENTLAFQTDGIDGVHFVPFEGMRYSAFVKRQNQVLQDQAQLHDLLKSLSNSGTASKSKGKVEAITDLGQGSGIEKVAAAPVVKEQAVKSPEPKKKFSALSAATPNATARPVNLDRDKMIVEEKMRQIGQGLRQLYSKLLSADRGLSGSVQFEARVASSGSLRLTRFTPRGSFGGDSIAAIHSYLNQSVAQVTVDKSLEGMVIRGEHILTQ